MTESLFDQASYEKFYELEKPELLLIAENFGTEFNPREGKGTIIKRMLNEGVTWEMYQDLRVPEPPVEEALVEVVDNEGDVVETKVLPVVQVEQPEEEVLIRMTRPNFTYEIRGYRFTRQHPFALVKEEDANYLIENDTGFRPASPREMATFYGTA